MNCHSQIWNSSPTLEPVRASFRTGQSILWTRVNDLPDFVYFNHSIHVNKGVGCESCHGRVDRMPLTWQENSLQMEWCLNCHRHPEKYVRPREFITKMGYEPQGDQEEIGAPADEGIQDSRRANFDELFHVPSMSDTPQGPLQSGMPPLVQLRPTQKLDLANVRARLEKARGPEYWRSLEDLASTKEFQELLVREFPQQAIGWSEDEDANEGRRNFLKLMGASLALAGLTACTRQPTEHIAPYIRQPEELIPGKPLFYATATTLNGVATGVLVESHEGRPTKVEGNPEHPASLGACDAFSQASVLQLYDPDRSQTLLLQGEIKSWSDFLGVLRAALAQQKQKNGAGIRILTETVTSPSMADQIGRHPETLSGREVASVGTGGSAQRPRRRVAGIRHSGQHVLRFLQGERGGVAGFRLPGHGRGQPALCAAVLGAPPRAGRPNHHEPALCRRTDADSHGQ